MLSGEQISKGRQQVSTPCDPVLPSVAYSNSSYLFSLQTLLASLRGTAPLLSRSSNSITKGSSTKETIRWTHSLWILWLLARLSLLEMIPLSGKKTRKKREMDTHHLRPHFSFFFFSFLLLSKETLAQLMDLWSDVLTLAEPMHQNQELFKQFCIGCITPLMFEAFSLYTVCTYILTKLVGMLALSLSSLSLFPSHTHSLRPHAPRLY